MAKEKKAEVVDETSEKVRSVLRKLVQNAILIGAVVAFIWVAWTMFFRSDPRLQFETIEETADAYTEFVGTYMTSTLLLPGSGDVEYFLGFFDRGSRDFFNANFEALARRKLTRDPERFESLGRDGRRGEAMLFLLNYPPLNGIQRISERRPLEGGNREEVRVVARNQVRRTVVFNRTSGRWIMEDFAGALQDIEGVLN